MMFDADVAELDEIRRGRMAECWEAVAPTDEEIRQTYLRFQRRRRVTPKANTTVLKVAMALAQGFVLGVVTAAPAAWIANHTHRASVESPSAPREAHSGATRRSNRVRHPSVRPVPEANVPVGVFADPDVRVPQEAEANAAGVVHLNPRTDRVALHAVVPSEVLPAASERREGTSSGPADGPWVRAARAIAGSDFSTADEALRDLSADPDPQTRDAAELTRAEMWVAHGRQDGVRSTIERLVREGRTPLVRRRAAALLDRLTPSR